MNLRTIPRKPSVHLSWTVSSDAAGAIGYGSTAPTGADRTAAVQAAVNSVPAGGTLIWDVAVGLSAPILLPSNITIEAPSRACGAILRAAANCPMFRLAGAMEHDATPNRQNTFGKLDPAHPGDANYRAFDSAFVSNRSITIRGGTWNGNKSQQTGQPFTLTYGCLAIIQFYGCEDILLDGCLFLRPHSPVPVHFINWHRVTIRDCEVDNSPLPTITNITALTAIGGFQFEGPGSRARMYDPSTHCSDDHIALNPDDSSAAAINNSYGGGGSVATVGVNWACAGDITDVRIYGHKLSTGIEGTIPFNCYRLYSTVHLLDDVIISGTTGQTQAVACTIGTWPQTLIPGPGNLGRIDFVDFNVELLNPFNNPTNGTATFEIRGSAQSIRILNRKRGDIPSAAVPDVNLVDLDSVSPTVRSLVLTGDYDSTNSNVSPQVKVSIPVNSITVATRSRTPSGVASPVLLTATGAVVDRFDFTGDLNGPTNVVTHAAGTLTTVLMRGSHRNANGGSPLDVASGLTVTNAWYKDLAYNHGAVAFKSGSGTVTHDNDYVESGAIIYASDTFTAADGTAIVGRTPAPISPGHNWALFEGTGAVQTILSNSAHIDATPSNTESVTVDCGHADGTITVSAAVGSLVGGAGLIFRATDVNNFWAIWINPTAPGYCTLYKIAAGVSTAPAQISVTRDTNPHALKAVLSGSSISVYYDNTLVGTLTDAFNATATMHGIRAYSVVGTFNNFKMTS